MFYVELGKENITDNDIRRISALFSDTDKKEILMESQRVTTWVYGHIKKICAE